MLSIALIAVCALSAAPFQSAPAGAATQSPPAGMLRYPDLGPNDIVFSFANDLWIVDKNGGVARPLTNAPGTENMPKFSQDGKSIAFVGGYEGNRDIYTIPAGGGQPYRVTHHPGTEGLCEWTPDGNIIMTTTDLGGLGRMMRLFKVPAGGGMPEPLPVPYGANGSISSDGEWLAYTPHSVDTRTWKRYRGGMATDIWLYNLKNGTSRRVTNWEGVDSFPMWHGDSLYYMSDEGEGHRMNIWKYNLGTQKREQVTFFTDEDVRWPAIGPHGPGPGDMVFQKGDQLMVLDLGTAKARPISVQIPGDRPKITHHNVDASKTIQSWSIGPTGKRVVVAARGDVWTLPTENGSPRNLVHSSGVAERSPGWSPDGESIAFFDDSTGEYELYIIPAKGKGEKKALTTDGGPFKDGIVWSPDSKKVLYGDKTGSLWMVTIADGTRVLVDKDPQAVTPNPSFSHDGAWIAYTRRERDRDTPRIWLYEVATGEKTPVTSGMFSDANPTFDGKGDYLVFASDRNFSPTYSELDTTWIYADASQLYLVPLRKDVKLPWPPESDEEEKKSDKDKKDADKKDGDKKDDAKPADGADKKDDAKPADKKDDDDDKDDSSPPSDKPLDPPATPPAKESNGAADESKADGSKDADPKKDKKDKKDDKKAEPAPPIKIDLDGFESRAVVLPPKTGAYGSIAFNDKNQLVYARAKDGIKVLDLTDKEKKEKNIVEGGAFEISADRKKLLVPHGNGAGVVDAAADAKLKPVITDPMTVDVDPRAEWKQIVIDANRIMRDWFYDEGMHQVDWKAQREHALKLLESANSREDVNWIIAEMISELNVGHAYLTGPGDIETPPMYATTGMLGVDWELADGANNTKVYRFAHLVEGAPWDIDAHNPLVAAGVKPGDYLFEVNGRPVDAALDPWAAFDGLGGKTITLTVSDKPERDATERVVTVRTMSGEGPLRYREWIERNRAWVDHMSDGQVGYIYVPNTGVEGQNDLVRQFQGNRSKAALIIDERWNGGGQIPNRFIEMMNRPATNAWARRDAGEQIWPPDSHQGPKAMLINGLAGSGGDMFPWLFKQEKLGPVIGMRTWGGLVGISGNPGFVDGGSISAPTFGFFKLDGTWGVEGHGVDPDIEVIDDPAIMKGGLAAGGRDPQLEKAVEVMQQALKDHPFKMPPRPAAPNRSGMGVPVQDH
ncbi:MAG: PDZ domain-containing protein [Planctomycetes bacterium]|nr:PDZ domain-containing protein [Planctomycetota bacterium]